MNTEIMNEQEALKSPFNALCYALQTGPFPAGEALIATDAVCSLIYGLNVLKGDFPLGDAAAAASNAADADWQRQVKAPITGKRKSNE